MEDILDFNWKIMTNNLILMSIAYVLALPIGWERERHERPAGLRTFPLVAVAACGYALIGYTAFEAQLAQARVVEGIITGIGFIGGGAILKSSKSVTGISTATAIWSTGAIGVAVAMRRVEIAIVLALLTFVTLNYLAVLKNHLRKKAEKDE